MELSRDFQLPRARLVGDVSIIPKTIRDELNFDRDNLRADVDYKYQSLNFEQKYVFDIVIDSVTNKQGRLFALDACGGTGKTLTECS